MRIKKVLRRFGVDLVRYRSFWDDIAARRGIKTILDIGANDGSFAKRMRERFPEAKIISFEPLQSAYRQLTERMGGDGNFASYHVALGETAGSAVIHRSASSASSSLLPMGILHKKLYPKSASHVDEEIKTERLDSLMRNAEIIKPVLVKIDVQGFEAQVLRGGSETIRQADIVLIENSFVPLYDGQALFAGIHDLMRNLGFAYRGRSETHYNEATGEPIYEDSIFIKEQN
jgi:FkbM family methyltransferase